MQRPVLKYTTYGSLGSLVSEAEMGNVAAVRHIFNVEIV